MKVNLSQLLNLANTLKANGHNTDDINITISTSDEETLFATGIEFDPDSYSIILF